MKAAEQSGCYIKAEKSIEIIHKIGYTVEKQMGGFDMAENRRTYRIKEDQLGEIRIADEVVAIIAGLAATEVQGVSSMAGNITNEIVSKLGMKNLSKGISVEIIEETVNIDVSVNIAYGYSIPDVSEKVQEKVKTAIENMTGLHVEIVNVRIASVDMGQAQ